MSSSRSTSIPHRTSVSSNTSSQHSHSQSQSRPQPQRLTAQQLADRVISPGSVLFQGTSAPPPARTNVQDRRSYTDMDRRHPSSFQQLEKVCDHIICWPPVVPQCVLIHISVGRGNIRHRLQRPQPTNGRTRCVERNSPRLRRRHTLDRNS